MSSSSEPTERDEPYSWRKTLPQNRCWKLYSLPVRLKHWQSKSLHSETANVPWRNWACKINIQAWYVPTSLSNQWKSGGLIETTQGRSMLPWRRSFLQVAWNQFTNHQSTSRALGRSSAVLDKSIATNWQPSVAVQGWNSAKSKLLCRRQRKMSSSPCRAGADHRMLPS